MSNQASGEPSARTARPAVILSSALVAAAVLQAGLWARFAPGTQYQVRTDGFGALPSTTGYRFVAAGLFALSGLVIGVTAAVGAWSARRSRGIPLLVVLVVGCAAGAVLAWGLGAWWAPGTDPAGLVGVDPAIIVTGHPTTGTWLVVLVQPTAAAAVFTALAAWNGLGDLGTGRPAVTAGGTPRTDPSLGIHAQ